MSSSWGACCCPPCSCCYPCPSSWFCIIKSIILAPGTRYALVYDIISNTPSTLTYLNRSFLLIYYHLSPTIIIPHIPLYPSYPLYPLTILITYSPLPYYLITLLPYTLYLITLLPYTLLPYYPITLLPYYPITLLPITPLPYTHYPFPFSPLPYTHPYTTPITLS